MTDFNNQIIKVVFTGASETGKTSLISGKYNPSFIPTIGVDFATIKF